MSLALTRPGRLLAECTSMGLGGRATAEVEAQSPEDFLELPGLLAGLGLKPLVLGHGSNIIAGDGQLDMLLIRAKLQQAPAVLDQGQTGALVRARAGMGLPRLLAWLAEQGLSGLEGLAGIPGSLGGAVAMNAGSYGVDMAARLERVRVYSPEAGLVRLERSDWTCAYRTFRVNKIKGLFVVLEADLRLERAAPEEIRQNMAKVYEQKKKNQPVLMRSAGCVFKNPAPGLSAGLLMDQAGLKGYRLGGLAFSDLHANFMVNTGGGTSAQALALIDLARERVKANSGHELELEVKLWA